VQYVRDHPLVLHISPQAWPLGLHKTVLRAQIPYTLETTHTTITRPWAISDYSKRGVGILPSFLGNSPTHCTCKRSSPASPKATVGMLQALLLCTVCCFCSYTDEEIVHAH